MSYNEFGIQLAKKSGAIIRERFTLNMKQEWKEDNTPVTETDREINKLVIDAIKKEFPGHNVLSEEGSYLENKSNFLWVCDPIDGTIPFSHGIPTCVFSLALVENGQPIMGIIFDPFLDRLFYAEKDKGAFLNEHRIHVNQENTFAHNIVAFDTGNPFMNCQKSIIEAKGKVLFLGSTSYSSALLSCGQFVGVIYSKISAHDGASVKIIVEEAGGLVTDLEGNEQNYDSKINGFVASNSKVHKMLVNLVKGEGNYK